MKARLDARVAELLEVSRTKAAALIMAGEVTVDGQPARKPGQTVADDAAVECRGGSGDVSRAAGKLRGVLADWKLPIDGNAALDVGASTGGFTQVLLEAGARKVFAVDVGHGQLAWSLRNDPRVENLERTDIRKLDGLPEPVALAVIDVSFISLRQVLPAVAALVPPGAPVVALFKPQFEVGRAEVSRGKGVVRDETTIEAALDTLSEWLTKHGWYLRDVQASAVVGTKGNRERLLLLASPAAVK